VATALVTLLKIKRCGGHT